jgi:hypothetical protein
VRLVLAAEPGIVVAVPVAVRLGNRLGQRFGDGSLHHGLVLCIGGCVQSFDDADGPLVEHAVSVNRLLLLVRRDQDALSRRDHESGGDREGEFQSGVHRVPSRVGQVLTELGLHVFHSQTFEDDRLS